MGRATLILSDGLSRQKASDWIAKAPIGTRVTFKASKRSLPQNDRMWAMLTEISDQTDWHGMKMIPNDWKKLFLSGLNSEMRMVPNLDGTGFVNLGSSSSDLSLEEMSNMIELLFKFGAERGIEFQEPLTT